MKLIFHLGLIFWTSLAWSGLSDSCSFNQNLCPVGLRFEDGSITYGNHRFVQDYGYGGFTSDVVTAAVTSGPLGLLYNTVSRASGNESLELNPECVPNPATPITTGAGTLYYGDAVDSTTRAELRAIQCSGRGYILQGNNASNVNDIINAVQNVDEAAEELVFLTAVNNIRKFNDCQNGLFRSLDNPRTRNDLVQDALNQFRDLRSSADFLAGIRREYNLRGRVANANSKIYCTNEARCGSMTTEDFSTVRTRDEDTANIESLREEINLALSRIPLANRDSMRTAMENLLMREGEVSDEEFRRVYDSQIRSLDSQLQRSRDEISDITVMNGSEHLYCIDRSLKENLYRSGQIDHTIEQMGLNESLSQFKLRSANRYGIAGTVITEVAMIPTYFAGYGAARLALMAGSSSVRAVAAGGRALSSITRVAMLGLEGLDAGSAIAGAMNDCGSNDFFARVDGQQCNPENEIGQLYEESSLAQCLTSTILPFAAPFVGAAKRVVSSPRLSALYTAARPGNEIVVLARTAENSFLTAQQARRARDGLRRAGVDFDAENIVVDAANANRLTPEQRISIVEFFSGPNVPPQLAREILALSTPQSLARGSQVVGDDLARLLRSNGLDASDAQEAARNIISSNALGVIPSSSPNSLTLRLGDNASGSNRPSGQALSPDAPSGAGVTSANGTGASPTLAPLSTRTPGSNLTNPRQVQVIPVRNSNSIRSADNFTQETRSRFEQIGLDPESLLNPRSTVARPDIERGVTRYELDARFDRWREMGVMEEITRLLSRSGLSEAEKKRYLAILLNSPDVNLRATISRLTEFKRADPARQQVIIQGLMSEADRLGDQIVRLLPETPANAAELARLTRLRSATLQETMILELGDNIEIQNIFSSRASNAVFLDKGYVPHSLDGTFSVDIRVTENGRLNVCRGSFAGPSTSSFVAGNFTTFCRRDNLQQRDNIGQFVAAPDDASRVGRVDGGYEDFWRYELREGDEISLGLNGPVAYSDARQLGSGGIGGGIEFFAYRSTQSPVTVDRLTARTRIPTCPASDCTEVYRIQGNLTRQNIDAQTDLPAYLATQRQAARNYVQGLSGRAEDFARRLPENDEAAITLLRQEYGDLRSGILNLRMVDSRDPTTILGRSGRNGLDADSVVVVDMTNFAAGAGARTTNALSGVSDLSDATSRVGELLNNNPLVSRYRELDGLVSRDLRLLRSGNLTNADRLSIIDRVAVNSALKEDLDLPLQALRYQSAKAVRDSQLPNKDAIESFINNVMTRPDGSARPPDLRVVP